MARESTVVFFTADGKTVEYQTSLGVDQGCPGSPVAFALGMRRAMRRIRQRVTEWLQAADDPALREALVAILSFLDDFTLIIPPSSSINSVWDC